MILEILERIKFWQQTDRIGPDIPFTHWRLFYKSTMLKLCKKKFKHFEDSAVVRPGVYVVGCSKISVGKRVVLRPGTMLHADTRENGKGIIIEDDVLMGSGIHVYVDKHCFDNSNIPIIDQAFCDSEQVVIKKGSWIGANCIILPGVTVGENSVVGAGSVVTKDIPAKVVAAGNPAKILKQL